MRFSLRSPNVWPFAFLAFLVVVAWLALLAGCISYDEVTCHHEAKGAIVDPSGRLAVGINSIQNAPKGVESAMVSYRDSMPLIGDEKEHYIQILLTGSNSVTAVTGVVSNICNAFIRTAPAVVDSKE